MHKRIFDGLYGKRKKNMPPKRKLEDLEGAPPKKKKASTKMSGKQAGSATIFKTLFSQKLIFIDEDDFLYKFLTSTEVCAPMLNSGPLEAPYSAFTLVMARFLEMDKDNDNRALLQAAIGQHITKRAVWQPVVSGTALFALDETQLLNVSDNIDQNLVWTETEAANMYEILGNNEIENYKVGEYVVTNRVLWNLVCIMAKILFKTKKKEIEEMKLNEFFLDTLAHHSKLREKILMENTDDEDEDNDEDDKDTGNIKKPTTKGINTLTTGSLKNTAQIIILLLQLKTEMEIKSAKSHKVGNIKEKVGLAFAEEDEIKKKGNKYLVYGDIEALSQKIVTGYGSDETTPKHEWEASIRTKITYLLEKLAWQHYGRNGKYKTAVNNISTYYMQNIMKLTDEAVDEMAFEEYVEVLLQAPAVIAMQYLTIEQTGKKQFEKQFLTKVTRNEDFVEDHLKFIHVLKKVKTYGVIGFDYVTTYINNLIEQEDQETIEELKNLVPVYMLSLRTKINSVQQVEVA